MTVARRRTVSPDLPAADRALLRERTEFAKPQPAFSGRTTSTVICSAAAIIVLDLSGPEGTDFLPTTITVVLGVGVLAFVCTSHALGHHRSPARRTRYLLATRPEAVVDPQTLDDESWTLLTLAQAATDDVRIASEDALPDRAERLVVMEHAEWEVASQVRAFGVTPEADRIVDEMQARAAEATDAQKRLADEERHRDVEAGTAYILGELGHLSSPRRDDAPPDEASA